MTFDYITLQHSLYGAPSDRKLAFLQSRQQELQNKFQNFQSVHSNQMQYLYNAFNSNEAIQKAKLIMNQADSSMNEQHIQRLNMNNYQNIKRHTANYMMANPVIYDKFNKQLVEGYPTMFVDTNPIEPLKRTDYMEVMSGIISDNTTIRTYMHSKDSVLSSIDKITMKRNWDWAISAIANDIDVTDV